MANPIILTITEDAWVKVATGVLQGSIQKCDSKISQEPSHYLQTYRLTGETAPANSSREGVRMFELSDSEEILSTDEIDVYVLARGTTGELRINL